MNAESTTNSSDEPSESPTEQSTTRLRWRSKLLVHTILPMLALVIASGAGYLKWLDGTERESAVAARDSTRAAVDSTIAMLSYRADTVDRDLPAVRDRLFGPFRDSYTSLIHDVVIPGAKEKNISATATVPAAASVSATPQHAVVLLFVNQSTTIGDSPPTMTTSSVKVTLDHIGSRWLVSDFTPV